MLQHNVVTGPQRAVNLKIPLLSGFEIPALGFGTYRLEAAVAAAATEFAIECGFRHIDCAKAYCNQRQVGEGIAAAMKSGRVRREHLFITGKLWPTDAHPDHVAAACRATLAELRVGYLDLFLVHWPVAWRHSPNFDSDEDKYPKTADGLAAVDESVTLADTWRAMEALVDAQLVRSLGLSNCDLSHIRALDGCRIGPVTNQIEGHPALQQHELRGRMIQRGILPTSYCPLAAPTRFTAPDYKGICNTEYLKRLAESAGFTPQRMLLNWAVDNNNAVLIKSASRKHIQENAKTSTGMLSDAQRRMIQAFEPMNGTTRVINPTEFRRDGKPFFHGYCRFLHRVS